MRKLQDLLLEANFFDNFAISKKQLSQDFPSIGEVLVREKLLVETQPDSSVFCSRCGSWHKVILVDNKYYANCSNDDSVALKEVSLDELERYKFSYKHFLHFLSKQLKLNGSPASTEANGLWYLGETVFSGLKYKFYFHRAKELQNTLDQLSVLKAKNPAIFYLGELTHAKTTQKNLINLLEFIDIRKNQLVFDLPLLKTHFAKVVTSEPGDIDLDRHIMLHKENSKCSLLLKKNKNNSFDIPVPISPLAYRVVSFLHQIRNYEPNARTARELSTQGLAKNPRTINKAIKEINDLTKKHGQRQVLIPLAQYKYAINPALDCMN